MRSRIALILPAFALSGCALLLPAPPVDPPLWTERATGHCPDLPQWKLTRDQLCTVSSMRTPKATPAVEEVTFARGRTEFERLGFSAADARATAKFEGGGRLYLLVAIPEQLVPPGVPESSGPCPEALGANRRCASAHAMLEGGLENATLLLRDRVAPLHAPRRVAEYRTFLSPPDDVLTVVGLTDPE